VVVGRLVAASLLLAGLAAAAPAAADTFWWTPVPNEWGYEREPSDDTYIAFFNKGPGARVARLHQGASPTEVVVPPGELVAWPVPAVKEAPGLAAGQASRIEAHGLNLFQSGDPHVKKDSWEWWYGKDAGLLRPTSQLGMQHVVLAWASHPPPEPVASLYQGVEAAPTFVTVTATAPDTLVTVRPSVAVQGGAGFAPMAAGETRQVLLQEGQVLTMVAKAMPLPQAHLADLSGTSVDADKPVLVWAGGLCSITWPYEKWLQYWCAQLADPVPPVERAGREFVTCHYWPSQQYHTTMVRVVAVEAATHVVWNTPDRAGTLTLAGKGAWAEIPHHGALRLRSDRPVQVLDRDAVHRIEGDPTPAVYLEDISRWSTRWTVPVGHHVLFVYHANGPPSGQQSQDDLPWSSRFEGTPYSCGGTFGTTPGPQAHLVEAAMPFFARRTNIGYHLLEPDTVVCGPSARRPDPPSDLAWDRGLAAWRMPLDGGACGVQGFRLYVDGSLVATLPWSEVSAFVDARACQELGLSAFSDAGESDAALLRLPGACEAGGPQAGGAVWHPPGDTAAACTWCGRSVAGIVPDIDGDGVQDVADNCPGTRNRLQEDRDGNGIGDACDEAAEAAPHAAAPAPPLVAHVDSDRDGVEDGADNCPRVVNQDQADLDGDGVGDPCDDDVDGDGVLDFGLLADNCLRVPNPDQRDADADGVGDACDEAGAAPSCPPACLRLPPASGKGISAPASAAGGLHPQAAAAGVLSALLSAALLVVGLRRRREDDARPDLPSRTG